MQHLFYFDVLFTTYFFSTDICYTKIIIKPQKYYLNIHLSLALKIYEIFFVDIKMFFSPNWWQYLYVKNENIAAAMLDNIVNPTITSTVGILFCIFQWTRWYPALNCKNIFFINFIYIYFFFLLFCASFVTKLLWRKKKRKICVFTNCGCKLGRLGASTFTCTHFHRWSSNYSVSLAAFKIAHCTTHKARIYFSQPHHSYDSFDETIVGTECFALC